MTGAVRLGRDVHDARGAARDEHVGELAREQEVAEVVDGERRLVALLGGAARAEDRARVVDEHVEARVAVAEVVGEIADAALRGEVADHELDRAPGLPADLGDGGLSARRIAADGDDVAGIIDADIEKDDR